VIAHEKIPVEAGFAAVAVIPHDAEAYARALYAELHRCDEAGAEMILIEMPPSGPEWEGIRDRLRRAAGG
jgi:L-threonylcarbamoyladenylate synthase